jgi:hypothetical protein
LLPVPTEPKPEDNNGPQMTPITDDNTGLIAGIDKLLIKMVLTKCLISIIIEKHN